MKKRYGMTEFSEIESELARADRQGDSAYTFASALSDAHAHLGTQEELNERRRSQLVSLICATTPQEAEKLMQIAETPEYASTILPTFGLHPWQAAKYSVSEMEKYFVFCSVIGEIGMDCVWCSVPLDIQERVFRAQLSIARDLKKPVILHTKGQEKEISSIIREYPNTYLVHWYSCPDYLEEYLEQDCYFSIGPDVWWNSAVRQVAERVPLNRILVETDGMDAVRWAWEEGRKLCALSSGKPPSVPGSPAASLTETLRVTARIRGLSDRELNGAVRDNFERWNG